MCNFQTTAWCAKWWTWPTTTRGASAGAATSSVFLTARRPRLAQVPHQPGHQPERITRDGREHVLVGRVLAAGSVGVRDPHGRQAEVVREDVVRQRAAEIRQDRGLLSTRLFQGFPDPD